MDNDNFFNPPPGFNPDIPRGSQPPAPPFSPPNFIPEAPGMGPQPFLGGPGSGTQFRGRRPNQPGSFQRCINRFTFIWLINGNSFWFYPTFAGWQHVEGFRWRNGRWVYEIINLRRILFFRCF